MAEMVPVTITGIVREHVSATDPRERFYIRLESAVDGDSRRLDIGVGDTEAASLGFTLQGALFRRPMTYQFIASLIEAAGSEVGSVRVTQMTDEIFYAQVTLRDGAVVDARPSDAINLAAVTGAPVTVASDLFDLPTGSRAQVSRRSWPDRENGPLPTQRGAGVPSPYCLRATPP